MKTIKRICFGILLFIATGAMAQDNLKIRGRITTNNPYSKETMALVNADLVLYSNAGGSWKVIARTITDPTGMYYFYGLAAGTYFLQVNGAKNFQITISPPSAEQAQKLGLRREQIFLDIPVLSF